MTNSPDQDMWSARRQLALYVKGTIAVTLAGALPAALIATGLDAYRFQAYWEAASSGWLEGERERALLLAGVGSAIALVVGVRAFVLIRRAARQTAPAPWVVATCVITLATALLAVAVLIYLGSPLAHPVPAAPS